MLNVASSLLAGVMFACALFHDCQESPLVRHGSSELRAARVHTPQVLEGSFAFVSEAFTVEWPEKRVERRTSEEWEGLLLLGCGRFSQNLMRRGRDNWVGGFPRNADELGFSSMSGSYRVVGNNLELEVELSLNPGEVGRSKTLQFISDGDTLTLVEDIRPIKERFMRGKQVTVFRRIN